VPINVPALADHTRCAYPRLAESARVAGYYRDDIACEVTHPSTNQTRRRLTLLTRQSTLLRQSTT